MITNSFHKKLYEVDLEHDDDYQYHGGGHDHGHGHGDGHGHGHADTEEPLTRLKDRIEKKKIEKAAANVERIEGAMSKLKLVSFVSVFFIIAQCTGGYLANSIAIFADTVHLTSDMVGFGMSILALNLSQREASVGLTFGWHRAEIIGTIFSVTFLVSLTIWLLVEAIDRVKNPQNIDGEIMLITAVCGLFFNLIQMSILHQGDDHFHMGGGGHDHGHDHGHSHEGGDFEDDIMYHGGGHDHGHGHGKEETKGHGHGHGKDDDTKSTKSKAESAQSRNINVDAAFLHALGDMIMSIGVIIASTIIYIWPTAKLADPICTFVFSVIVVVTVYPIMSNCLTVLMEGAPDEID
jgi:zinc transporter 2